MANKNQKLASGIEVNRKNNESVGNLSRRFVQRVKKSGVLLENRKNQYQQPKQNKRARRESALVREKRRKEYEKLRKWGKL